MAMSLSALSIALQHEQFTSDVPLICRLLCTSHTLSTAVHASLQGTLTVQVADETHSNAFVAWLHENAVLLKDLKLSYGMGPKLEAAVGRALHEAAQPVTTVQGLLLQSLAYYNASSTVGLVLDHLPSQYLTSLDMGVAELGANTETVAKAMARLTGLKALSLRMQDSDPEQLLPAIAGLTNLTSVHLLAGLDDVASLQHLPQQLHDLLLWIDDER